MFHGEKAFTAHPHLPALDPGLDAKAQFNVRLIERRQDKLSLRSRREDGLGDGDQGAARDALNGLDRNGAKSRQRNRCVLTGRPRAFYNRFGLCRNKLRELASKGMLPGVRKASW